jgi:hypothetical protein
MLAGDDLDIGGHAGQQAAELIVGGDDHGIGDDVLQGDRREPDLLDRPLEGHVRVGIDGEANRVAAGHLADIGFIDLRLDLHLVEILGDGEELRRLQARRHGLPDLDDLVDHHPVDGRADIGAAEVDAGAVERCLMLGQRGLGSLDIGLGDGEVRYGALLGGNRGVESRLRRGALGDEFLGTAEVELGLMQIGLSPPDAGLLQVDIGLGHGDGGFLLAHARLEARRLDSGEHLALLDLARIVNIDRADIAGELRADIDGDERAHGA